VCVFVYKRYVVVLFRVICVKLGLHGTVFNLLIHKFSTDCCVGVGLV